MIEFMIFALGAVFGSFCGVLIYRIPRNQSIVTPRSYCENCNLPIKFFYNIPIIGYLLLLGKSSCCKTRIPIIYLLVEIVSGIVFLSIYLKYNLSFYFIFTTLSFMMLLVLGGIDFYTMQAPDNINFLALAFAICGISFDGLLEFVEGIKSALILAGTFSLLRLFIGYLKGEEALGEADIIVVATLGALLGTYGALESIFIGSLIALPVAIILRFKNQNRLPFIPFLSVGGFIQMVFLQ